MSSPLTRTVIGRVKFNPNHDERGRFSESHGTEIPAALEKPESIVLTDISEKSKTRIAKLKRLITIDMPDWVDPETKSTYMEVGERVRLVVEAALDYLGDDVIRLTKVSRLPITAGEKDMANEKWTASFSPWSRAVHVNIKTLDIPPYNAPIAMAAVLYHEGSHAADPGIRRPRSSNVAFEEFAIASTINFIDSRLLKLKQIAGKKKKFTTIQASEFKLLQSVRQTEERYREDLRVGKYGSRYSSSTNTTPTIILDGRVKSNIGWVSAKIHVFDDASLSMQTTTKFLRVIETKHLPGQHDQQSHDPTTGGGRPDVDDGDAAKKRIAERKADIDIEVPDWLADDAVPSYIPFAEKAKKIVSKAFDYLGEDIDAIDKAKKILVSAGPRDMENLS